MRSERKLLPHVKAAKANSGMTHARIELPRSPLVGDLPRQNAVTVPPPVARQRAPMVASFPETSYVSPVPALRHCPRADGTLVGRTNCLACRTDWPAGSIAILVKVNNPQVSAAEADPLIHALTCIATAERNTRARMIEDVHD